MRKNFILAGVSLLVALVLLELTLRTTHLFGARISWSRPDPLLSSRFVPNSQYWFLKENDHPISGKINRWGWRDRDWSLNKGSAITRIAVMGDSYVEAFQVESESTFVALTETALNSERGARVECMNFGHSGFTQTEELLALQNDVARFSPDLVILFMLPENDIEDIARETAPDNQRPFFLVSPDDSLILDTTFHQSTAYRLRVFVDPMKRSSALVSLMIERYAAFRVEQALVEVRDQRPQAHNAGGLEGFLSLCTTRPDSLLARSYRLNKRLLREMSSLCSKRSTRFLLVCTDTESYIPEVEQEYKSADSTFNFMFFDEDLQAFADSIGCEFLGLQKPFREAYVAYRIPLHWGHWNYAGHRIVARELTMKIPQILGHPH